MVEISDHAVLRYLERVYRVDIDAIREEMRCPGLEQAAAFGCETVKLGNGARLKIVGRTVVTVLAKRGPRR
jgi:hypothetical protein